MNCEDIAFNLMVANATGKPPIKVYKIMQSKAKTFLHIYVDKVGPRKKFKCSTPSCENVGMLSSAAGDHSGLWSEKMHICLPPPRSPWGEKSVPGFLLETIRRSFPFETGGAWLLSRKFSMIYFRSNSELILSSIKTIFPLQWKSSMTWGACDILPSEWLWWSRSPKQYTLERSNDRAIDSSTKIFWK